MMTMIAQFCPARQLVVHAFGLTVLCSGLTTMAMKHIIIIIIINVIITNIITIKRVASLIR